MNTKTKPTTYHCVYKTGLALPVAMFLNEKDALEWHANPNLYQNGRRQFLMNDCPKVEIETISEGKAFQLLSSFVDSDCETCEIVIAEMERYVAKARSALTFEI